MGKRGNLFDELKRRNVFRVGAAYAVVGWLVLQVIDTVAPGLGWPDWILSFFIVLVAVGFPIALIFAWAFELTPEGLKKSEEVEKEVSVTTSRGHKLDFAIIGFLVLALGYFLWERQGLVEQVETASTATATDVSSENASATSIAVLPFVDMSAERDQEYLGDGIAEELLNVLVRIEDLRVPSRTSSFVFKGKEVSIREVADVLEVEYILEGSVRKSGNRVRITAQLIDVTTDTRLWSETYDRELTDIFAVQDDIAGAIGEALQVTLRKDASPSASAGTADADAYDLYLLGRYHWNRRTPEGLLRAIEIFEQAIALDPTFARAHSGLGLVYSVISEYVDIEPELTSERARDAAQRALELDPGSVEALVILGNHYQKTQEYARSEETLLRAISVEPDYPTSHHWYGMMLLDLGRFEDAQREIDIAHRLEPSSPPIHQASSLPRFYKRQYREALEINERLLERLPRYRNALAWSFHCRVLLGDPESGRDNLKTLLEVIGEDPKLGDTIIAGIVEPTKRQEAKMVAIDIASRHRAAGETELLTAILMYTGAHEEALNQLEGAPPSSDIHSAAYDPLRDQPRFHELLDKWNMPNIRP
jgi:TolB-like protein